MTNLRQHLNWLACALATIALAHAPLEAGDIVLHNFAAPHRGTNPFAGVIRDQAGNLYGTTGFGGSANRGVVFKVDTQGQETVLYSFTGGADGAVPEANVIGDGSGNLYGTTNSGGASNAGVVFRLDAMGQETVLYSFTGGADGGYPYSGVIRDTAGNLYGTTTYGGGANLGVVYKLDATGHETVLHSFTGAADGGHPNAGLILDAKGNLYGTTVNSGTGFGGVVFRMDPMGNETVLHSFSGEDGVEPYGGLIGDGAGNLYGTTFYGGTTNNGVVYKLDVTGKETVLYNFTGGADGGEPQVGVIRDAQGNLYGTTLYGGGGDCPLGCGVVYKLDAIGQESVLHAFTGGADGANGYADPGLIRDAEGNLYGATSNGGGPASAGVVFELDPAGQESVLYTFPGGSDGANPHAGVISDGTGNLYGTTYSGGPASAGVVYQVDATGHETILYRFTGGADGANPNAGAIRDSTGNLYGTTIYGGIGYGVVYKLDTAGNETVLHTFTGGPDGAYPYAGVIRDSEGNLYGTASRGGPTNSGVVYKVGAAGDETVLYSFTGGPDGSGPQAGVIRDMAGNLYGTTVYGGASNAGVVYELHANGLETVLHSFTAGPDGANPYAGLIGDSAGNLYGTTYFGGPSNAGVVYKVNVANKHETVLYIFAGANGANPESGVIGDSAGNLYGTTAKGGLASAGVVYKLDPIGQETLLYSFKGGTDGANPLAGLILDSAGNLFGTTSNGGNGQIGLVFALDPTAAAGYNSARISERFWLLAFDAPARPSRKPELQRH
jgi:uncharacterized repeat protein (TIGR03803 family)